MTEIKKRNRDIIRARENGVTGAFLGRKYGLSRGHISHIYKRGRKLSTGGRK